jgi:vacuolar-type H+-ATPase subunit I/STV1
LLYACWHLVTATLILSAIALFWLSSNNRTESNFALPAFIGILWVSFGVVFIFVALYFSGIKALLVLPQWTLLIPIGGLTLFGVRKEICK